MKYAPPNVIRMLSHSSAFDAAPTAIFFVSEDQ
jgi:hypothetical protein